jgi:hypothetical protein
MADVAKGTVGTYMETSLDMHNANQKYWPTSEFCTNDFIRKSHCSEVIHATSIAMFQSRRTTLSSIDIFYISTAVLKFKTY